MPTSICEISDRDLLHQFFLSRGADPYALANLDEPFWPRTKWWGSRTAGRLGAVVGTIEGVLSLPILYAMAPAHDSATASLLAAVAVDLPERMLGLLPIGVDADGLSVEDHGEQWQMALTAVPLDDPEAVDLGPADLSRIPGFLATAYRDDEEDLRVFEPYMIERWPHAAIIVDGRFGAGAHSSVVFWGGGLGAGFRY